MLQPFFNKVNKVPFAEVATVCVVEFLSVTPVKHVLTFTVTVLDDVFVVLVLVVVAFMVELVVTTIDELTVAGVAITGVVYLWLFFKGDKGCSKIKFFKFKNMKVN